MAKIAASRDSRAASMFQTIQEALQSCHRFPSPYLFRHMKMLILMAALTLDFVGLVQLRADDTAKLKEFAELEQKMSDALMRGDGPAFARQVAEDWKIVLGEAKTLTIAQVSDALAQGKMKFRSVKVTELEARSYGDTAIVIGVNETSGSWNGEDFQGRDRFTDVFVKKDGAWKCVASHTSTISEE